MSQMIIPVIINVTVTVFVLLLLRSIRNELRKSNKMKYMKHVIETCKRIHKTKHKYDIGKRSGGYIYSKEDISYMKDLWDIPNYTLSFDKNDSYISSDNVISLSWIEDKTKNTL